MSTAPLTTRWTGEALQPIGRSAREADAYFVIGQTYQIVEHKNRSSATHNHEFAWLHEAWQNLPEELAELYPSVEHLRKRALIQAGYFDEQAVDAGSNAAALRVAALIRSREEFSLVLVKGAFVLIRTAKSQSRRAMNAKEFQESKSAVMAIVSDMIGIATGDLRENAGRAA